MKILHTLTIILFSLLLGACGSTSVKPERPASPTAPTSKPGTGGGYYLDDGPGEISQAELERIPDAVPRAEPLRAANSRPYTALGRQYVPMSEYRPYKQRGIASWYGKRYHGNQTASGERYDMYAMTAAHTTLPIPSYVRVTNPDNGRPETMARAAPPQPSAPNNTTASISGVYVQVGAFKSRENADRLRESLQNRNLAVTADGRNVPIQNWYNEDTYRVRLGPYQNRSEADLAASRINQSIGTNAIVVFQN